MHPQKLFSCQCSLLHTWAVLQDLPSALRLWQEKGLERGIFCVSQPLCSLYLLECGSPRKAFLHCFGPASAGVTSLFGKGLFHMRTLTLQPSISCTLVLGRFCGSAGCPLILLKTSLCDQQGVFPAKNGKKSCWIRCLLRSTVSGQVALPHLPSMLLKPKQCTAPKTAEGEKSYNYSTEKGYVCLDFGLKTLRLACHST